LTADQVRGTSDASARGTATAQQRTAASMGDTQVDEILATAVARERDVFALFTGVRF
jgi:hypothetical protein